MKRTFILEDLDCAHCAQKIEDAVAKIDGVSNCKVTFLTQKLVYDVDDAKNDTVEKEMKKIVKSTEPDVTVKAV
ncbi:MAG: cation transporter [Lachnospiraceae bacterium]|jgi:cation transport ATPase|nr:cation transporter [Lachnospiraceae bacterium]